MKVLHIITNLGQGGAEAVLYRLIEATHQKINHRVVSLQGAGVYGKNSVAHGRAVKPVILALPLSVNSTLND